MKYENWYNRDTVACGLLLVIGFGIILHMNNLFKE